MSVSMVMNAGMACVKIKQLLDLYWLQGRVEVVAENHIRVVVTGSVLCCHEAIWEMLDEHLYAVEHWLRTIATFNPNYRLYLGWPGQSMTIVKSY